MAKQPKPENLVRPVLLKKNCRWYVKREKSFVQASFKDAMQTLRDAGYKVKEALATLTDLKNEPYTEVKERKNGQLVFTK